MREIGIKIRKPDDTREYFPTVKVTSESISNYGAGWEYKVEYQRNKKDPIHAGLVAFWKGALSKKNTYNSIRIKFKEGIPILLKIEELPIAIQRTKGRYKLNGKSESATTIANALARVTVTAIREKSATKLLTSLMKVLSLSENVKYCLENRVPFHYYINFERVNVRLNVQQISEKECAIEISDGVWASITNKELDKFCTFFLHGKKQGKFKHMGIKKLYTYLMGNKPNDSDLELMRQFLRQNRQQDIVEDRAIQLLHELVEEAPDRLHLVMDGKEPKSLFVKGQGYDWLLTATEFKSDIQMVSTYVCQPMPETKDDKPLDFMECQWKWKGPICIDNMAKGSSLGDQFATRALALINDTHTIQIVNTIKRYLITDENTNRKDFDEMLRVQHK